MKTITYSSTNGTMYPDAHVELYARRFLTSGDAYVHVANESFITAVRVLIHEGVIAHTEVEFLFEGQKIRPDANGRIAHWPLGFCHVVEGFLIRLLSP